MLNVQFVLTDIEGTTTSVSFVYDVLFPYFRNKIWDLVDLLEDKQVTQAFEEIIDYVYEQEGLMLLNNNDILEKLVELSRSDLKLTPLKTLQGKLWKFGYESGQIQGHVYEDVKPCLQKWQEMGIGMGVFSSGSIEAQKLLFGHSEAGDLTPYFSAYFDTVTGPKRETQTYHLIAEQLKLQAADILFLSDVAAELEAADEAGFQTMQLLRPGTEPNWIKTATDFKQIHIQSNKL